MFAYFLVDDLILLEHLRFTLVEWIVPDSHVPSCHHPLIPITNILHWCGTFVITDDLTLIYY
jgi:prepilin signal peptidase PulO-like enzyme (type II secretory pathway)